MGGFFSIPHSQLYAEPERLSGAGYLRERREQAGRRRKHSTRSPAKGSKALEEWLRTPTEELYELRDPGLLKLAFGGDPRSPGTGSARRARGAARGAAGPGERAPGGRRARGAAPGRRGGHRPLPRVRPLLEEGGGRP